MRVFTFWLSFACISVSFVRPAAVLSEDMLLFKEPSASLRLSSADKQGTELLTLTSANVDIERIFPLSDPPRIVIDLRRPLLLKEHTVQLKTSRYFSSIRTGRHPQQARIVLDVRGKVMPAHSWRSNAGALVLQADTVAAPPKEPAEQIALARPAAPPASPAAALPRPTLSAPPALSKPGALTLRRRMPPVTHPQPAASLEAGTALAAIVKTEEAAKPQQSPSPIRPQFAAVLETPPVAAQAAASSPAPLRLQAIAFRYEEPGHAPLLALQLTDKSKFTLTQKTPRQYELTIPKCESGSANLALPHFPPQDFKGFTMLTAQAEEDALKVVIGVDRGARVTAVPRGNDVLLKAVVAS